MKKDHRSNYKTDFRMDFKFENVKRIDATHIDFTLIPDPQRYELKTINGEKCYFDKLDKVFIPANEIAKALENLPIYSEERKISKIEEYTKERVEFLRKNFENISGNYELKDQHEFITELSDGETRRFVILSIDLIGSTKMSQELSREKYIKVISVFLGEVSQLIYGFNGCVLKYTGDGLIAYFAEASYIGKNDIAVDCAMSVKYFILEGLNTVFSENGLSQLGFRIGLDSGEITVTTIGLMKSQAYKDLIGQTINLATKIQGLAEVNQIAAGEATIKNSHYMYRNLFQKIDLPDSWEYSKDGNDEKYSVYVSKF